jgi:hypothetical protein
MSLMFPTASYDPNGPASKVALAAATLRPWDVSYFVPDSYSVRPYVDVRALDGPFVIQFRAPGARESTVRCGDRGSHAIGVPLERTQATLRRRRQGALSSGREECFYGSGRRADAHPAAARPS